MRSTEGIERVRVREDPRIKDRDLWVSHKTGAMGSDSDEVIEDEQWTGGRVPGVKVIMSKVETFEEVTPSYPFNNLSFPLPTPNILKDAGKMSCNCT